MKKKIAIQFSGLIRGFRFEKTRNLIYENIIQELYKQNYDIDIFIHTYDIEYDMYLFMPASIRQTGCSVIPVLCADRSECQEPLSTPT